MAIGRRKFMVALGGAAVVWPMAARAQQPAMPGLGFVRSTSPADSVHLVEQVPHGLKQAGSKRPSKRSVYPTRNARGVSPPTRSSKCGSDATAGVTTM